MKDPLFSIISVLKNNYSTFKMKESLNRQSFKNYEHLIILSNNIKDNTEELVEKLNVKTIVKHEEQEHIINLMHKSGVQIMEDI